MKFIITIIYSLILTIAIGQKGVLYEDLRVDIFDSKFNFLKIKEIEQSKKYTETYKLANGKDTINSYSTIQYVLRYDSLNRIQSVFYDFEKEFSYNDRLLDARNLGQKPVDIILSNSNLYPFYNGNDTIYYNYYEYTYIYNKLNKQLESIKYSWPLRYIIDGVFLQESKYMDVCYKYTYDNNEITKREMYSEGKLTWTTEYFYNSIYSDGEEIKLLSKIIEKSEGIKCTVIEYQLKYKP